MIITLDAAGARLDDAGNLKAFKAVAPQGFTDAQIGHALAGAGRLDGEHAWISEAWLRQQTADRDAAWQAAFDGMLTYARAKGWIDEATGSVRAHLERQPDA